MLGRKDYTREELEHGKAAVAQQLAAYRTLNGQAGKEFESVYFNTMALALDRLYVHRLRSVTGKDTSPLNELEMIADSLMNHAGVLKGNNVIKYVPDKSVAKLKIGDPIRLTADQFERLSAGVFDELEQKYV